jgi:hypothetical protein
MPKKAQDAASIRDGTARQPLKFRDQKTPKTHRFA